MGEVTNITRWSALVDALERLAACRSLDAAVEVIRSSARMIAGADGITFVRREGDQVRYVAEDACGPLWTGQSFPIQSCISGIAMMKRQPIVIGDIRQDPRVPLNAYLSTFVKSMAMFPVGVDEPVAAIGAYWKDVDGVDINALELMTALARATAAVLDAIEVITIVRTQEAMMRITAGRAGSAAV